MSLLIDNQKQSLWQYYKILSDIAFPVYFKYKSSIKIYQSRTSSLFIKFWLINIDMFTIA